MFGVDDAIIAAIITAIASAAGSIGVNAANSKRAKEAQAFSEKMANTAHQREVADLRAAGLNPLLSAGGRGAESPAGVYFDAQNPMANVNASIMGGVNASTARAAQKTAASAQESTQKVNDEQIAVLKEQAKTLATQQKVNNATAVRENAQANLADGQFMAIPALVGQQVSQAQVNNATATKLQNENVKGGKEADLYRSPAGDMLPLIDKFFDVFNKAVPRR